MPEVGRKFQKRYEGEAAFGEPGVRDYEIRSPDDEIREQENVDVDGARAFGDGAPAPELLLYLASPPQQLQRKEVGLGFRNQVEKPALARQVRGFRFVDGRDAPDRHLSRVEFVDGGLQHGFTIAYV